MKILAFTVGLILGLVLILAACGSSDEPAPVAPAPTTSEPEPTTPPPPPPTTEEPADEPSPIDTSGPEFQRLALDLTWSNMSASDQVEFCDGAHTLGVDLATTAFLSGTDGEMFDREVVSAFIAEKCGV